MRSERLPGSGRGCGRLWDSCRIVCTNAFRPCAAQGVGVFVPDKRLASAPHLPRQPEEQGAGTPRSSAGEGRSPLLLEMGRKDFGYLFLTICCTMALKLSSVSSISVAGLGYVVTAALVLSAVVSDGRHN